jgi:hypothetical protein
MPSKFPGAYQNDTKQDDSTMHYVRDGGFENLDIGARKSGMISSVRNEMGIDHVGNSTPGPVKSKFGG